MHDGVNMPTFALVVNGVSAARLQWGDPQTKLGHADIGNLRYADIGELRYADIGELGHADIGELRHADIGELGHTDIGS
jgi:hypothetical protein